MIGTLGTLACVWAVCYLLAALIPEGRAFDADAHNRKLLADLKARDPKAWARVIQTEAYQKYADD